MLRPPTRRLALFVGLLLVASVGSEGAAAASKAVAPPAAPPWDGATVLEDPTWRKRFLGSYGVLSRQEPEIREAEREILTEVIDIMGRNPRAAQARLRPVVGAGSSANLDFVYANLQFQNDDLDGAVSSYELALSKFPDFRRAHNNLALIHVQRAECTQALPHLTRAIELGERDGRSYGLMGYCYLEVENLLAAEEAYRNAILQEPESRDWKLGLARSLLGAERWAEAIALLERLIDETPEDVSLWLLQANAFLGSEQPDRAAANLEAVRLLGTAKPAALVLLGDIYMNAGVYDLAKDAYLEVVAQDAESERADTAIRAAGLLVRTAAFEEAAEVLGRVNSRYGDSLTNDQQLEVLELEAKVAAAQGRAEDAARILETIVRRDGTRGEALLALADHARRDGEEELAVLQLERAARLEAFEYKALLKLAQISVGRRDYAQAAEHLRGALSIQDEPRVARFLARVEDAIR